MLANNKIMSLVGVRDPEPAKQFIATNWGFPWQPKQHSHGSFRGLGGFASTWRPQRDSNPRYRRERAMS
jgi:hypothetical protein